MAGVPLLWLVRPRSCLLGKQPERRVDGATWVPPGARLLGLGGRGLLGLGGGASWAWGRGLLGPGGRGLLGLAHRLRLPQA